MYRLLTIGCMMILLAVSANPACSQLTSEGPFDNPIQPKDETEEKILNALEEIGSQLCQWFAMGVCSGF